MSLCRIFHIHRISQNGMNCYGDIRSWTEAVLIKKIAWLCIYIQTKAVYIQHMYIVKLYSGAFELRAAMNLVKLILISGCSTCFVLNQIHAALGFTFVWQEISSAFTFGVVLLTIWRSGGCHSSSSFGV